METFRKWAMVAFVCTSLLGLIENVALGGFISGVLFGIASAALMCAILSSAAIGLAVSASHRKRRRAEAVERASPCSALGVPGVAGKEQKAGQEMAHDLVGSRPSGARKRTLTATRCSCVLGAILFVWAVWGHKLDSWFPRFSEIRIRSTKTLVDRPYGPGDVEITVTRDDEPEAIRRWERLLEKAERVPWWQQSGRALIAGVDIKLDGGRAVGFACAYDGHLLLGGGRLARYGVYKEYRVDGKELRRALAFFEDYADRSAKAKEGSDL